MRFYPYAFLTVALGLQGWNCCPVWGKAALMPTTMFDMRGAKLVREEGVIVRGIRALTPIFPPLIIAGRGN